MDIEDLGWTSAWAAAFDEAAPGLELRPGRVAGAYGSAYRVWSAEGETAAVAAGRLRGHGATASDLPTVGDWVAFERVESGPAVIRAVLPRTTCLLRKAADRTSEAQPLAANVDSILLVMGLDGDFNLRRVERALVMIASSGARPVVVLNKADLASALEDRQRDVKAAAPGVAVLPVSARTGEGVDAVGAYLGRGQTVVLIGSSGAGKSTLANRLLGTEHQRTGAVREHDQRGRHTTTTRQLFLLPAGGLLIDTPGIREIQLAAADEHALDAAFQDIAALARGCRYRDCRHDAEPGCAVRDAVAGGALSAARLASLRKLEGELEHQARREDPERRQAQKARWKAIHKAHKRARRLGLGRG